MSHSKDKQDQVLDWFGTINHPKEKTATSGDFEAVIDKIIKSYSASFLFATILHDKDTITNENGEIEAKMLHLHLFLNTRDKAYTKEQILDHLEKHLELPRECIQIEPARDLFGCIQYLTHKRDKWKYQYPLKAVITNHWEELEKFYLNDLECLEKATTYEDLFNLRGLKFIKDYRPIWNEMKSQKPATTIEKENALYVAYFDLIHKWLDGEEHNHELLEKLLNELDSKLWTLHHNSKPRF